MRSLRNNLRVHLHFSPLTSISTITSKLTSELTQVEVRDGKSVCQDRPRRKVPMSRPSQTESAYVQTFVRSCSDCRAFTRFSCVHVQTFVRSPEFRAIISRISCVHIQILCVHQIFVRSSDFGALTRLSCVHQIILRSPKF